MTSPLVGKNMENREIPAPWKIGLWENGLKSMRYRFRVVFDFFSRIDLTNASSILDNYYILTLRCNNVDRNAGGIAGKPMPEGL